MKKIIFLITTVAFITSCEKKLDQIPLSAATSATYYSQTSEFVAGVNSVYNDLKGYPDRLINLSETRSDNLYATADGPRDWEPINNFQKTISGNPYVIEAWNSNFNGIYRANGLLEQLALKGSVITPATLKTQIEAEAKFLRAFYYFDLVRWFGAVPLADHTLTATEAATIKRSKVSDVYNLIISDLQFAGANLPDVYAAAADKGRATKYAAKSILALVYMTRSGSNYGGIEGPGLGLNEWPQAVALLNEIIASNKYTFGANYANIFSFTNENNPEVVFDVQYVNGLNPAVGATFPWITVPDSWFLSLGKAIQGGLLIRPVSTDFLNTFVAADTRKTFYIQPGYTYNGVAETRSFLKKYIDLTKIPTVRTDWPINFIVSRYTDILMLKAECILRGATTGGTQADVDAIVTQVRNRAGITGASSNITLAQLLDERRKEFGNEGLRWHDLVRSGNIETIIPAWIATEDVLHQIQPFNKNFIIYPVPQAELDARAGLYTQNTGY
jgi:starch-binding outer membrane protein, SusD/RagB family